MTFHHLRVNFSHRNSIMFKPELQSIATIHFTSNLLVDTIHTISKKLILIACNHVKFVSYTKTTLFTVKLTMSLMVITKYIKIYTIHTEAISEFTVFCYISFGNTNDANPKIN